MKVLVYTANFNNYDWVYYPINKDKQTTYLYFTDTFIENKIWNFKHVDYNKIHFDPKRVTNYFKVGMHDLPNHDISVWIDSSVKIINSLRLLINYFKKADVDMIGFKHYRRNCVYDEGEECANLKLDDPKIIQDQMQKYRKQNYPVNNGLLETAIMIRKNNKKIKDIMRKNLPIIPHNTPKEAVSELLKTHNAVLVKGKKGKIIGIITPADLL